MMIFARRCLLLTVSRIFWLQIEVQPPAQSGPSRQQSACADQPSQPRSRWIREDVSFVMVKLPIIGMGRGGVQGQGKGSDDWECNSI